MILHTRGQPYGFQDRLLGRLTSNLLPDTVDRHDYIFFRDSFEPSKLDGYAGVLTHSTLDDVALVQLKELGISTIHSVPRIESLRPGQVILMDGKTGFVRILFRPDSKFNSIFATDRCNSRCLMCSQPPRDIDDNYLVKEHLRLIDLMDPDVEYLGITGGEPTLLQDNLFRVIAKCKERLPKAHIHILTNGRLFYYEHFARKAAEAGHPRLYWAIPLYSDIDVEHDYVVQAKNAFLQTNVGISNLARYAQQIEIRVVLHALTYKRLPQLAKYVYRNFPYVSHVALMGLELAGYAKANLDLLWVDPYDYQDQLEQAVNLLANRGINVSIYNHQLCVLKRSLWPFARHAISDWKNVYFGECSSCAVREQCGGFFASNILKRSSHIRAFV